MARAGEIGGGKNSGFQALNVALQAGSRALILVGFDMRLDRGTHWHGAHPVALRNPKAENVKDWCRILDGQATVLAELGATVFNTSEASALTAYPKATIADALAALGRLG